MVPQFDANSIVNNIASSAIWALFVYFLIRSAKTIQRYVDMIFRNFFWKNCACVFFSMFFLWVFVGNNVNFPWFISAAFLICLALRYSLRGLINAGVVAAYETTEKGIDYKHSLERAERSIDFLGIGADKLSSLPEFEAALRRCAVGGRKVRMLLSPPENPLLATLARRNESDPATYARKVHESLERIAKLTREWNLDVEVRFYPTRTSKDFQQFRLMFIDKKICLMSWTIWGSHIGKGNPQLVLRNDTIRSPPQTAYQAFMDYFERIWVDPDTTLVDLSQYERQRRVETL